MGNEIWEQFRKEVGETKKQFSYFKPEFDTRYVVTLASFKLSKRSFKATAPVRWTVDMQLKTIDGEPTTKEFGTQSITIIKKLSEFINDDGDGDITRLKKTKFEILMQRKNNKTNYVFEVVK